MTTQENMPGTPARLQIAYCFVHRPSNVNDRWLQITAANQALVRRSVALQIKQWIPLDVRDAWLTLEIEASTNGYFSIDDAVDLMEQRLGDSGITLTGVAPDPAGVRVAYNIHDDVQCTSVVVPLETIATGAQLVHAVQVSDPALSASPGTFEAFIALELKWEVDLSAVTA